MELSWVITLYIPQRTYSGNTADLFGTTDLFGQYTGSIRALSRDVNKVMSRKQRHLSIALDVVTWHVSFHSEKTHETCIIWNHLLIIVIFFDFGRKWVSYYTEENTPDLFGQYTGSYLQKCIHRILSSKCAWKLLQSKIHNKLAVIS